MKVVKIIILLSVMLVFFSSCSEDTSKEIDYTGWHDVTMEGIGTFMIPSYWAAVQFEDSIYIVDKPQYDDFTIIMAGTINLQPSSSEHSNKPSSSLFSDMDYVETLSSNVVSNSAIFGQRLYMVENVPIEYYYIFLSYSKEVELIIVDESVEMELFMKIVNSYNNSIAQNS